MIGNIKGHGIVKVECRQVFLGGTGSGMVLWFGTVTLHGFGNHGTKFLFGMLESAIGATKINHGSFHSFNIGFGACNRRQGCQHGLKKPGLF